MASLRPLMARQFSSFSTTINTTLQLTVPDHLRGRATLGIEAGICAVGVCVAYTYRLMHREAFATAARVKAAERAALGMG